MNRELYDCVIDNIMPHWHRLSHICRQKRIALPLWIIAFLTAWFALTLIYAGSLERQWDLICNSDLVMPFMVMRDVFNDPASLMTWELSPANYVFPDWMLAGILQASPLPRRILPFAYGGFLLASFGFCIGWILTEMRITRWPQAAMWGTTLIGAVFLANNATRLGFGGIFIRCICAPYIHSGAILSGLILIPLLARVVYDEGAGQRRSTIASGSLIALACYSDPIFAIWFAAPVCMAYLTTTTRMPFFPKVQTVAGLAVVGGVAAALDRWLRPTNAVLTMQRADVFQSIDVWHNLIETSISQSQWQLWLPVILSFGMLGRGIWLTCTCRDRAHAREDSIEVALVFATVASLVLPMLMGVMIHPSLLRYSLPVVFLPYVWVLACVSRWYPRRLQFLFSAVALVFWLACVIFIPRGAAGINKIQTDETLSGTLASLGQRAGYGDYWTAKRTMFETDYNVHCVQIDERCKPLSFNYNSAWFKRRADDGGDILPTFVVMSRLDESAIRDRFGKPDAIKHFQGDTIWLYDKPLPLIAPIKSDPPNSKNALKCDFVGIGTANPETPLHVARQNHPDLFKLQNLSEGGASWLMQIGGNGWQDGNLMFSHRPSGKYSLVMEPSGKVVVMGDMHVAGKLTTAQPSNATPKDAATAATAVELKKQVESLTALVEELLGRVSDLEQELQDAAVPSP